MEINILKIIALLFLALLFYFGIYYGIVLKDMLKFGFDDVHIKGQSAFAIGIVLIILGLFALFAFVQF